VAKEGQTYPMIHTKNPPSPNWSIGPEIVPAECGASRINNLLSDNNRRAITHVLANLDETNQVIARAAPTSTPPSHANKAYGQSHRSLEQFAPDLGHVDLTVEKYGRWR